MYSMINVEITINQMLQIENRGHQMGFLKKFMMENAGAAASRHLLNRFVDISSKHIVIFVGNGNNGGDGMVVARHMAGLGAKVDLILLDTPESIKTDEANWNWNLLTKMNSVNKLNSIDQINGEPDAIVDAILGTGFTGTIREPYRAAVQFINDSRAFKLSVDIPTGLDLSADDVDLVVRPDVTVTFHKVKIGMKKFENICGRLVLERIGIPPEAEQDIL